MGPRCDHRYPCKREAGAGWTDMKMEQRKTQPQPPAAGRNEGNAVPESLRGSMAQPAPRFQFRGTNSGPLVCPQNGEKTHFCFKPGVCGGLLQQPQETDSATQQVHFPSCVRTPQGVLHYVLQPHQVRTSLFHLQPLLGCAAFCQPPQPICLDRCSHLCSAIQSLSPVQANQVPWPPPGSWSPTALLCLPGAAPALGSPGKSEVGRTMLGPFLVLLKNCVDCLFSVAHESGVLGVPLK